MEQVLIVEDSPELRRMLVATFEAEGMPCQQAADGPSGIQAVRDGTYMLVITDLRLPGADGLAVLRAAREANPEGAVIVITAYGTIETAVQAVKAGAFDFITKPFDTSHLLILARRALEAAHLRTENMLLRESFAESLGAPSIIGRSPALQAVVRQIQQVGASDATVLLLGESGTGKELMARALHHLGPRAERPFVAINCAAIPDALLENELFGHERGAYTGADSRKLGKVELADGGTLFLDEIGDLSPGLQAKLLRMLQEREFERVGGVRTIKVDLRVIAASNQDLPRLVRERRFREDLYYRLSVFPVRLPPLRERTEDLDPLALHFLERFKRDMKLRSTRISPAALQRLQDHSWPGNVRELQNCIERAVILAGEGEIRPEHLGFSGIEPVEEIDLARFPLEGTLAQTGERARRLVESRLIATALERSGGNKSQAARLLDVNYKTLLAKIRDYGLGGAGWPD